MWTYISLKAIEELAIYSLLELLIQSFQLYFILIFINYWIAFA